MLICGLRALQNYTFWLIHIYVSLSVKQVGALEIELSFVTFGKTGISSDCQIMHIT